MEFTLLSAVISTGGNSSPLAELPTSTGTGVLLSSGELLSVLSELLCASLSVLEELDVSEDELSLLVKSVELVEFVELVDLSEL